MKKIFIVGIGGIGISALARMYKGEGFDVSGSDISENDITKALREEDIEILIGQNIDLIPAGTDLVVYTNALKKYEPELLDLIKEKFETKSYPEAISELTKEKKTIAISGTHGKTTTTALLAHVLIKAGLSPTVIVGSVLKEWNSNFIKGESNILVLEADEYAGAFLNYYPKILAINNIAEDHLDYYKTLENIQSAFRELAERIPEDGLIVTDTLSENIKPVISGVTARVANYKDEDLTADDISLFGEHNLSNSKVVFAIAQELGVDEEEIKKHLKTFQGASRRFEFIGENKNGAKIFDDYAHNPDKVYALIEGAKKAFPDKKINIIFQPHLFSRTKDLFDQFSVSFNDADRVYIAPIYKAREHDDGSINHQMLAEAVKKNNLNTEALGSLDEVRNLIAESFSSDDIVILTGAGDINNVAEVIRE